MEWCCMQIRESAGDANKLNLGRAAGAINWYPVTVISGIVFPYSISAPNTVRLCEYAIRRFNVLEEVTVIYSSREGRDWKKKKSSVCLLARPLTMKPIDTDADTDTDCIY